MASSSSSTESTADKCIKPMFTKKQEWQNTGTPDGEVMVFYPTKEEFANFSEYIAKIEQMNAHLSSGICKIVPPPDWRPRPSRAPGDYSDVDDFKIECPVRERIEQVNSGCYVKNNTVYRKQMRVADFRRIAESKQYRTPNKDYELLELERYFWRNLLHHEPIYGADTPGSIYDTDVPEFNMSNLGTILDLLKEMKVTIRGVNTVFMYFGMWKTMFPWHAEDMDLYSINYLHFGEPKFWYAIPSQAAEKFERLAAQRFPDGLQICKAFLRHKLYIISPHVLKTHGIPHGTMVQYPGEFIITFPKGYHMGFNLGYNCAESTNFALDRWIDYGKNSLNCFCRKDSVEIDMRPFVKKYRPEEYEKWFEYWYTERPTSYKPKNPDSIENSAGGIVGLTGRRHRRKGSQDTEAVSSEDSLPGMPFGRSICPKRQKKIFHARQPVNDLWANQPPNLFAEKEHNAQYGRLYPHCCVCQYFWARKLWTDSEPVKTLPDRSRRYVTNQMFNKDMLMQDTGWLVSEDDLLECTNCRMVVHRNCYPSGDANRQSTNGYGTVKSGDNGDKQHESMALPCVHQAQAQTSDVKMDNKDLEERKQQKWLCERCLDRDDTLIRTTSCKLCELRGGALVEVEAQQPNTGNNQNNDFVHVICALIHRPTRFLQPRDRRAPFSPPPRRLIPTSSPWSNHDHNYGNVDGTSPRQQSPRQQMLLLPANGSFSGNQHFSDTVAGAFFNDSGISESSIISTMNLANSSCSSTAENHTKQSPFLADSSKNNNSYSSGSSPSMQSMACRDMMVTMRPTPNSSSNNSPQHQPMEYPACYQCEVCGQQADSEKLIRCDVCLAQDELGAKLRFHVTCAPFADVIFERRNFPECVSAVCSFHNSDQALIDPRRFKLDQRVIVHEEEEGIIGYGSIEEITEHLFATVDFLDGSVSGDIFPIDIRNCECKHFGCNGRSHIPGSLVYVDWHDEKNYEAYYRGKTPKNKFTVKLFPPASFDSKNGEFIEIDSTSIYRKDELELPEAVRQKLFKRKPK